MSTADDTRWQRAAGFIPAVFELPPPGLVSAPEGDVHVWRLPDEVPARVRESLRETLSADERARADRFLAAADRQRFVERRGAMRAILARYVGVAPAELDLVSGPHGRPALAGRAAEAGIDFNLTHSGDLALLAVARGRRVGVDLERLRTDLDALEIAERFFCPAETAALRALPAPARVEAFFRYWTAKEAFLKATGTGLSAPLDGFEVSLAPDGAPTLAAVRAAPEQVARWSMRRVDPDPGYLAVVVAEGPAWRLGLFRLHLPDGA